jgi:hypothetical protein
LHDERGQVLPLLALAMIGLLAAGVLVYELAFSTNLASVAQTAADAAALAGEKVANQELTTPPGVLDPTQVQAAAEDYAERNHAHVISLQPIQSAYGEDVMVTVRTNQAESSGGSDIGPGAVAEARASTDPFASGSQPAPISGDASVSSGPRFIAHGGQEGFFPDASANYSVGYEPEIAGRLDQLAQANHLHLEGLSGYRSAAHSVEVGGNADDPHTCGAASDTPGIEGVSEATLEQFGLTRPFPNDPKEADHIQLEGTTGSVCATGGAASIDVGLTTPGGGATPNLGNPNVHLVPLTGGPQGLALAFSGLASGGPWSIPAAVVNCESGGRNTPPNSASASGYYQITVGTWGGFGGYPAAYLAPKPIQDAKAAELIKSRGLEPWASSQACWGPVLGVHA